MNWCKRIPLDPHNWADREDVVDRVNDAIEEAAGLGRELAAAVPMEGGLLLMFRAAAMRGSDTGYNGPG